MTTSPQGVLFTDPAPPDPDAEARIWERAARRALAAQIIADDEFDAYTLAEAGLPEPPRPRLMSSLFGWAHRARIIERTGYRPSRRPTCGAIVATWQGTGKGRRWASRLLDAEGAE